MHLYGVGFGGGRGGRGRCGRHGKVARRDCVMRGEEKRHGAMAKHE